MRKNVKRLALTGIIFLAFCIIALVCIDKLNEYANGIGLLIVNALLVSSIILFSIFAYMTGKGDHLLVNDLIPGKEYILIDHISINGSKTFSLVGTPKNEKYVTVHGDDNIFNLGPKQSFIIVKGLVRKLT